MHSRLVRKSVHSHVRLIFGDRHIRRFGDGHRALVYVFQVFRGDALISALELQVADHRREIGVAAPFSEAEEGALDLPRARFDRLDGIGHGQPAVVVAVDRHDRTGEGLGYFLRDRIRFVGEDAPVRVAKAKAVCARLERALQGAHRVRLVRFKPVEKVFRVEDDFFALRREKSNALPDHG